MEVICKTLKELEIGDAFIFQQITVFPLFHRAPSKHRYISLSEAFKNKWLEISEISASGSVPYLKFNNLSEYPVLILDGEDLKGPKQNRTVNATFLIAAKTETIIPVSCTEQGRWRYTTRQYIPEAPYFHPPEIRFFKAYELFENLKLHGEFHSDQAKIWQKIREYQNFLRAYSPTSAFGDIVAQYHETAKQIQQALPLQKDQCGMMMWMDGKFESLDYISEPNVYAEIHQRLVTSYLIHKFKFDMMKKMEDYYQSEMSKRPPRSSRKEEPKQSQERPSEEPREKETSQESPTEQPVRVTVQTAKDFLDSLEDLFIKDPTVNTHHQKSVSLGEDWRALHKNYTAFGLTYEDELIHSAVLKNFEEPKWPNGLYFY